MPTTEATAEAMAAVTMAAATAAVTSAAATVEVETSSSSPAGRDLGRRDLTLPPVFQEVL